MSKRSNLSYDDGMMLWKTRDAYRVQTVLLAVFYLPQFLALFALSHLSQGRWSQAAVYLLGIGVLYAARWLVCTGLPRLVRWGWQSLLRRTHLTALLVLVALGLSGCSDMVLHGNALINGVDCRPEAMQNGQCRITRGASK